MRPVENLYGKPLFLKLSGIFVSRRNQEIHLVFGIFSGHQLTDNFAVNNCLQALMEAPICFSIQNPCCRLTCFSSVSGGDEGIETEFAKGLFLLETVAKKIS